MKLLADVLLVKVVSLRFGRTAAAHQSANRLSAGPTVLWIYTSDGKSLSFEVNSAYPQHDLGGVQTKYES